jgi:phosphate ABC transporter permease subunit PstA
LLTGPVTPRRSRRAAPSYVGGAIVATVFFFPIGIFALRGVVRGRRFERAGRREDARLESEKVRNMIWWAVGLGLSVGAIVFIILLLTMNGGAVRSAFFNWSEIKESFPAVLEGFKTNISLFMVTEVIVLGWALVIAIVRNLPGPAAAPVRFLAVVYTDLFRGLPAIIVIYIVEYGRGRLASVIQFFVDVMTGIPSIVAGLFILTFWVLIVSPYFNDGRPGYSGFAAALALSVLMLPTITRSSEEMLRLVPAALREGAYALGIAKWKTIVKIVLPTAATGIVTGVMLAIARAAGETAPVLLVAGGTDSINTNPFTGNQESLSVYIYSQAGLASPYGEPRAWSAALTLVVLVLALTIAAKLLARRSKLK